MRDAINFSLAIGLGVLVSAAVYLTMHRLFSAQDPGTKKALSLFAGTAGFVTSVYLYNNPSLLADRSEYVVLALIGLVIALIAALRRTFS